MELFLILCWLIGVIIGGCIWGAITNAIISGKGYDENWFWWGFFFGFFAVLVALIKPRYERPMYYGDATHLTYAADRYAEPNSYARIGNVQHSIPANGWKCNKCGRGNASYVGTCGCGNTKTANSKPQANNNQTISIRKSTENNSTTSNSTSNTSVENKSIASISVADEIFKFKKLLDDGVITQEEFDKKKKQLLDM